MSNLTNVITMVAKAIAATTSEGELRSSANVGEYITKLYGWVIPFAVGIGGLVIVYAGYIYVTSQGNPDSTKQAKDLIVGALIGLALILLAGLILRSVVGIPEVAPT